MTHHPTPALSPFISLPSGVAEMLNAESDKPLQCSVLTMATQFIKSLVKHFIVGFYPPFKKDVMTQIFKMKLRDCFV
jgi:hypothetical protein